MNTHTLLTSVVAAALLTACSRGGETDLDMRTFEIEYGRDSEALSLIRSYMPHAKVALSLVGRTVTITVSGTREDLDTIARLLAEFDRPQLVRLTFRLIEADGATTVDPAIADVEAVLRTLFRFQGYRLAAEAVVSGVEGSEVSQVLSGSAGRFDLGAEINRLSGKGGDSATVQLGVRLISHAPPGTFRTRLGLPLGRTAVLGNVQGGSAKTTLILTVRPELVSASP